jgi:hypothetical protein
LSFDYLDIDSIKINGGIGCMLVAEEGEEGEEAQVAPAAEAEGQEAAGEWGEEIARAPGPVETASAHSAKRRYRTRGERPVIR